MALKTKIQNHLLSSCFTDASFTFLAGMSPGYEEVDRTDPLEWSVFALMCDSEGEGPLKLLELYSSVRTLAAGMDADEVDDRINRFGCCMNSSGGGASKNSFAVFSNILTCGGVAKIEKTCWEAWLKAY